MQRKLIMKSSQKPGPCFAVAVGALFLALSGQAASRDNTPYVLTAPTVDTTGASARPKPGGSKLQAVSLGADAWTTAYDGYGSVTYSTRYGITLEPQAATDPSITHAALTLANLPLTKNFRLSVTANTTNQLRLGSPPNFWEVFWLFFNYNSTDTGKSTNYFLLKPTGAELGTAFEGISQTFLQTGPSTATAIGVSNKFDVEKIDNHVTVSINGQKVIDFTGAVVDVPGSIGLYTEDARVQITSVSFLAL